MIMQNYIIFGSGVSGARALHYLGYNRVSCFCDNNPKGEVFAKKVISVDELLKIEKDKYILVIASEKYHREIEEQVINLGFTRYFVFREEVQWRQNEVLPFYWVNRKQEFMNYTQVLSHYPFRNYNNIVILGINMMIPYLISEVSMVSDISCIKAIVSADAYEVNAIVGIPVINRLEDILDIDCLIVNVRRNENLWIEEIEEIEAEIIYIYDIDNFIPCLNYPELINLKDIYKNKRIFLVGNGSSMTIDDLNKLWEHQEICIGFNKIYRIFDETKWRPNYIGMTDPIMMEQIFDEIEQCGIPLIIADRFQQSVCYRRLNEGSIYYHMIDEDFGTQKPRFSSDITKGMYLGCSSVYDIGLQLAAYMGASEIYIVGVDNEIKGQVIDECNHFIKNYYTQDEKLKFAERVPNTFAKSRRAYEAAEKYSRKHGFRIYNATRGGALEAFERVNFDDLFK